MPTFSQIKPVSLREQVAAQIRTAIIEGQLKPNDHVVEASLTQQLGVSRTPVREALILLEREALIVSVPNRGAFVRAFNEQDVWAIFTMRTALENFAAELIIERMTAGDITHLEHLIDIQHRYIEQNDLKRVRSTDMSFHQYLVDLSDHPLLKRSWQEIVAQIAAVLYVRAEGFGSYDEFQATRDHQAIVEAYRACDLERVRYENKRINNRVAQECAQAIEQLNRQLNGTK